MEKSIFSFSNYYDYLDYIFPVLRKQGKSKAMAAQAMGAHPTFLSQVLKRGQQLSLEHGLRFSRFVNHSPNETKYFQLILSYGRASTHDLKDYLEAEVLSFQKSVNEVSQRIGDFEQVDEKHIGRFYTNWNYQVAHALVSIESLQTPQALAQFLGINLNEIQKILDFLSNVGLVNIRGNRYQIGQKHLHLPSDSPFIPSYHSHWRLKAIESLKNIRPSDLHYSAIYVISQEDATRIKETFLQTIKKIVEIAKASPEKEGVGVCLDLFNLAPHDLNGK